MQRINKKTKTLKNAFRPCCLCGRTGIKRFSLTIGLGNHRQKKFVCKECRKKPNFRFEVEQKFFCLMPIRNAKT